MVCVARLSAVVLILGWAQAANAHPGYPPIVDATLSLTGSNALEAVLPPTGCQLCHTTSAGGNALNKFGNLMLQYGLDNSLINEDDASLKAALFNLQSEDREAVKDLRAGVDPNSDPVVFANVVTPEYGCTTAAGSASPDRRTLALLLAASATWAGLRRRTPKARRPRRL
jgi:hypothetical protein